MSGTGNRNFCLLILDAMVRLRLLFAGEEDQSQPLNTVWGDQ